ncbi:MAG: GH36-type glycosyl hydrolase domain-containing protein [Sphingomonadaceae bacterium]
MIAHGNLLHDLSARDPQRQPEDLLRNIFSTLLQRDSHVDAQFVDSSRRSVVGVAGLPFEAPVVARLLREELLFDYLEGLWRKGRSVLITANTGFPVTPVEVYLSGEPVEMIPDVPAQVANLVAEIIAEVRGWAGILDENGHHVIDPTAPPPGPHFFTNLLIGNRIGYPKPLQTTPKSVVDHLGRGSFRSHADTQVLATRWDMRAEENGFPANRQFYLTEQGRQIFYSADPSDPNVEWARTTHAPNRTTIRYRTRCGLEITRTIFLLPHEEGLPLATEAHSIVVANCGATDRHLRIVVTGMFGAAQADALREDVLYTNLTLEGRVLLNQEGSIVAVSPHYHPFWAKEDVRFHSMVVHQGGHTTYPTEYTTSYNEFVGNGTLERPQGVRLLSNRLARKGPGFFALAAPLSLPPGGEARADNFTGLVSSKADPAHDLHGWERQIHALLERFGQPEELERARKANDRFLEGYSRHWRIRSEDPTFDRYVNQNLPFQILYQTFVSRSFDQTQKGHREIGAREIQDLFASMPFFLASGHQQLVKDLLREWANQVFEFGYANHNFYWVGKQPGEYSDDALWLVQALGRYLRQSGDVAFLDEECRVAGTDPRRSRTVYETVQAILRYSGEISVGRHGLPLLDKADWNDTLQVDKDFLNGPQKEAAYRRQLQAGGTFGEPLDSDYSESVMNGFLLKVAIDEARHMAESRGDEEYLRKLNRMAEGMADRLQRHAWKGDFFARVLFNKYPDGRHSYLGAGGDGLSADPSLEGTYFLNSFTWSILAGVATEAQIATMLQVVKRVLWTPHGLKLCSPVDFSDIAGRGGSGEYFQGDRENGGVFKHADAMAVVAMFDAARRVDDPRLAEDLADLAYRVLDAILPYRSMNDPYVLCGNPRFCTQYNNSETGENVGPTLSGTATWLQLALASSMGLSITPDRIEVDPILRWSQRWIEMRLRTERCEYSIQISKPVGFFRTKDNRPAVRLDGVETRGTEVPHRADGSSHTLEVAF